jgi:D-lyxose ketol-isomerase
MPLTREQFQRYQEGIAARLDDAGVVITPRERDGLEVADFGLGRFESEGLGLITYVNTPRTCAKELVMWPGQTCPQHRHPPVGDDPGKEETFRVRQGECILYVDRGAPASAPRCKAPNDHYMALHEVVLRPGEQYTIPPDTWHWFQAGPDGCVVSEFSTTSRDEMDIFLDPNVARIPVVEE